MVERTNPGATEVAAGGPPRAAIAACSAVPPAASARAASASSACTCPTRRSSCSVRESRLPVAHTAPSPIAQSATRLARNTASGASAALL